MAYDELQRDPSELVADFIEHTATACWDLQYYLEWCLNRGIAPDPAISELANVLSAFRAIARSGLDSEHQLAMRDECPWDRLIWAATNLIIASPPAPWLEAIALQMSEEDDA